MKKIILVCFLISGFLSHANAGAYANGQDERARRDGNLFPTMIGIVSSTNPATSPIMQLRVDATGYMMVDLGGGTTLYSTVYNYQIGISTPIVMYGAQSVFTSSGTSGSVIGVSSGTITVADKVTRYKFYIPSSNASEGGTVKPSVTGVSENFYATYPDDIIIDYPEAITFTYTIPNTSTMCWRIQTIK